MGENNFNSTVASLFKGMEGFLTTKTVVGDAVKFDDGTIILPLVDVSFGLGAGAFSQREKGVKENAGGGMGGKVQPSAILVIKAGETKLVNVKNQDGLTKVLDMLPEFLDKHMPAKDKKKNKKSKDGKDKKSQEMDDEIFDMMSEDFGEE